LTGVLDNVVATIGGGGRNELVNGLLPGEAVPNAALYGGEIAVPIQGGGGKDFSGEVIEGAAAVVAPVDCAEEEDVSPPVVVVSLSAVVERLDKCGVSKAATIGVDEKIRASPPPLLGR